MIEKLKLPYLYTELAFFQPDCHPIPFPAIFKTIEEDPPQTAEAFADVLFLCSGIKKEKHLEKWRDVCSRVAKHFDPDYHPHV